MLVFNRVQFLDHYLQHLHKRYTSYVNLSDSHSFAEDNTVLFTAFSVDTVSDNVNLFLKYLKLLCDKNGMFVNSK